MIFLLLILFASIFLFGESATFPNSSLDNIAICLTGQLKRLELGSKLERIVKHNLKSYNIGLFIVLDNSETTSFSHPTFYSGTYKNVGIYDNITALELIDLVKSFICVNQSLTNDDLSSKFHVEGLFHPPIMKEHMAIRGINNCMNILI
jgi:hypothetical protein